MAIAKLISITACVALLTGCAGDASDQSAFTASTAVSSPSGVEGAYAVASGDVLSVTVFQVPDLTREVQVGTAGQITLPLIGQVQAAGKSAHTIEAEIAAKLKAKYLQSPQVTVFLKTATGQQVTISGSVNKPGVYPIAGRMTLIQAIALAGELDQLANSGGVSVTRKSDEGRVVSMKFNMDDLRSGKTADPLLYPGDTIFVDTSGNRVAWKNVKDVLGPALGTAALVK